MKKPTKRLALSTQTIRLLQTDQLEQVAGGSLSSGTSIISRGGGTTVQTGTSIISSGTSIISHH